MVKLLFLLVPLAAAFSIRTQQDFTQVISDCNTVDTNILSLTSTVQSFTQAQGLVAALPIFTKKATLATSIDTANMHAKQCATLTAPQAADLAAVIEKKIIPHIATLVAAMEAKKNDFLGVNVLSIVQGAISSLQTAQAAYSKTLVGLVPTTDQARALADAVAIDGYFSSCAAFYAP